MNMKWKMGFLFLPLLFSGFVVIMLDKYVGPGAGSIAIAMIGVGISVATCVWLIEKMKGL